MRRNKVITKLEEQKLVAEAMLNGEEYFAQKFVKKADEDGNQVAVTVPKRVTKWFYTNNGLDWFLEVKYGNSWSLRSVRLRLQWASSKTSLVSLSR